jgi:thiol-disulfide isomerase/thioredoxin
MRPIEVNFYKKENCPLCDKGKAVLDELAKEFPLAIKEYDIYKNDQLLELYQIMIPVVEIDGEQVSYGILDKDLIRKRLLGKIG